MERAGNPAPVARVLNPIHLLTASLAVVPFIVVLSIAFFPGLLNPDSVDQLYQATVNSYKDPHPPLLAFIWRGLNQLYYGPASLFEMNIILFVVGLVLFTALVSRRIGVQFITMAVICLYPSVFFNLGMLTKDVSFMAFMLVGQALILSANHATTMRIRLVLWSGGSVFLILACGTRHEGTFAVIPVIFITVWPFIRQMSIIRQRTRVVTWLASGAATVVIAGMCLGIASGVTTVLTSPTPRYPSQMVMAFDLAAISVHQRALRFPDYITAHEDITLEWLDAHYTPFIWDWLYWPSDNPATHIPFTSRLSQYKDLLQVWLVQIILNPLTYLRHRMQVFCYFLGITGHPAWSFVGPLPSSPNQTLIDQWGLSTYVRDVVYEVSPREWLTSYIHVMTTVSFWPIFSGWFYVALCMITVIIHGRYRRFATSRIGLVFALSGVFHVFPFLLVGPGYVPRYLLWINVSALCAVGCLFGETGERIVAEIRQVIRMALRRQPIESERKRHKG